MSDAAYPRLVRAAGIVLIVAGLSFMVLGGRRILGSDGAVGLRFIPALFELGLGAAITIEAARLLAARPRSSAPIGSAAALGGCIYALFVIITGPGTDALAQLWYWIPPAAAIVGGALAIKGKDRYERFRTRS